MTCPYCHQPFVEVDNPMRREFRHRRGTECTPVEVVHPDEMTGEGVLAAILANPEPPAWYERGQG